MKAFISGWFEVDDNGELSGEFLTDAYTGNTEVFYQFSGESISGGIGQMRQALARIKQIKRGA